MSGEPPRTRTPDPATGETDASHGQFAAQPLDQAQSTAKANALAESFVDTLKTELIADRVWQTRSQLELAIVEYLGWFNHDRLHESLGDIPPAEFEALYAPRLLSEAIS
jgi:transposase InsO family protein